MKRFGLNDYTYNLLIEYFKSKPDIKVVRIFGSRVLGTARKNSDIDFFVECTCSDDEFRNMTSDLNLMRQPYDIDLINLNTEISSGIHFIKCSYYDSEVFYKRKDYFQDETYTEKFVQEHEKGNVVRWKYRFETAFIRVYKDFKIENEQLLRKINFGQIDVNEQIDFFRKFKNLFQGCWKTLKDYLNEYEVKCLMPRDILIESSKLGIVNDYNIWSDMIFDFNIMTDEFFVTINEELIYRLENKYLPEIEKLYTYLQEQYEKGTKNKYSLFD